MPSNAIQIPQIQHVFPAESRRSRKIRLSHLDQIKAEFMHAWSGYKTKAWLSDELMSISGKGAETFGGWAVTIVDSLDTLWIMGLKDEFEEAVQALDAIDFSTNSHDDLSIFETTIRVLGGFLGAYDLTEGRYPSLLQKAWEVGNMLYAAFDTPNRMPVTDWNFKDAAKGRPQEAGDWVSSAELGSLTLEFTRLSQLTGDPRFYDAVQRIMDVFDAQQNYTKLPGMWPKMVDAKNLRFASFGLFTLGARADSLYEYLPKQHMMLGGATAQYRKLFELSAAAMKTHLFYRPMTSDGANVLVSGDVSVDNKGKIQLDPKNQHLTCFAGGMFGIAGQIFNNAEDTEVGRRLTEGCLWSYEVNRNGIMPEDMYTVPCSNADQCAWDEKKWDQAVVGRIDAEAQETLLMPGVAEVSNGEYSLRPEAIESVFILYRITGNEDLRERAWTMFKNIIRFTRTPIAHAVLKDCTVEYPPQADNMPSFWTAETLKYFYLLFSEPDVVSLDQFVFNTEAHPLRRPNPPRQTFR
ncbi:Class i alpha-mannosidase [Lasiodiplodia theobromae]|uniref:Class i alpha-mannosidase n=1 Tax=Lasiodiplodia theobromae TaxID=45133 RepID=UPI0015C38FD0|nr:Class i alpha-mannosidase [Lasiodiplodia theobromae]KAF4534432.1 Class i alpha-mannosidase [Lasiodiplodia theobromae]